MWWSSGKRPKEIESPSNYLCCNFVNSFSVVVFIVCVVDSTCPYVIAGMISLQLWYWLKSCAAACSSGTHSLRWPHRLSASANSKNRKEININPPQLSDTHTQKINTTIAQQHKPTPKPGTYHRQILLNHSHIHHSHNLTDIDSKTGVYIISNLWFNKQPGLVCLPNTIAKTVYQPIMWMIYEGSRDTEAWSNGCQKCSYSSQE